MDKPKNIDGDEEEDVVGAIADPLAEVEDPEEEAALDLDIDVADAL